MPKMLPVIVVFDGVCTLCNHSVDFLMRHDRTESLMFTSFQSEAGRTLLARHGIDHAPTTIYVVENDRIYTESTGILRLCRYLDWPWRAGTVLLVIPAFVRNIVYRIVARNRYRWFGERDTCRLPTPKERRRFLE
ncbi:MAG: DUF393 domain-containing protein ['Candidatus Kapabacteria' thiocyanatum]|uniref:Thiol-disulfide oxidoreductase n=1 Tax=Candidatus Kapaibacterium thiocyanatum TaxID=1895771 RepID=A0A1M3KW48_9BACT|nr:DUF393 domain-containing protein ['Candidatus Kapabacteria' thiocyanatum]OJX56607.1 MAG: hypothetical protein BGO89_08615 ['Candidatus Kapabacteria' thiocyanatum]